MGGIAKLLHFPGTKKWWEYWTKEQLEQLFMSCASEYGFSEVPQELLTLLVDAVTEATKEEHTAEQLLSAIVLHIARFDQQHEGRQFIGYVAVIPSWLAHCGACDESKVHTLELAVRDMIGKLVAQS